MKTLAIATLFMLVAVSSSFAAEGDRILRFGWDYDPAAAAIIDGFYLYEDGKNIQTVDKTLRTVDTMQIKDSSTHTYHLTAFQGTDESGPSNFAVVPAYYGGVPKIIEGSFRFQILDGQGNVIQ